MDGRDEENDVMHVYQLRVELGKMKCEVDGSKEALMARLKEAKRQKTE